MFKLFRLIRIHHWIKNFYIFIPVFFSKKIELNLVFELIEIFFIFSLAASIIYIFNDLVDYEKDRKNIWKKNRPIASKEVSLASAKKIGIVLFVFLISLIYLLDVNNLIISIIGLYFLLNFIYSVKLKNILPLNIVLLLTFFYLRLLAGNSVIDIDLSIWLTTFVILSSLILILGKKITDLKYDKLKIKKHKDKLYFILNLTLITQMIIYLFFTQTDYAINKYSDQFSISFIFVVIGTFRYLHIIKNTIATSDQISLFIKDKILLASIIGYLIFLYSIIYY